MTRTKKRILGSLLTLLLAATATAAALPFTVAQASTASIAEIPMQYTGGALEAYIEQEADTVVLHFDQSGGVFKSLFGYQYILPHDYTGVPLNIYNSTGSEYQIVDITVLYEVAGLPRAYNAACEEALGEYSAETLALVRSMDEQEWYAMNDAFFGFAANAGSLATAAEYTRSTKGFAGREEPGSASYEWARLYMEGHIWVSFDNTALPASSYDPALSVLEYNQKTAGNRAAVAALSTPFGAEGFSTGFGVKVHNFNNYVGAASHELEFTITLARVPAGEPDTTTSNPSSCSASSSSSVPTSSSSSVPASSSSSIPVSSSSSIPASSSSSIPASSSSSIPASSSSFIPASSSSSIPASSSSSVPASSSSSIPASSSSSRSVSSSPAPASSENTTGGGQAGSSTSAASSRLVGAGVSSAPAGSSSANGKDAIEARTITPEPLPLGSPAEAATGSWSLLNLLFSSFALLGALLLLARTLLRRGEGLHADTGLERKDSGSPRPRIGVRVVAGTAGLLAPLLFLVLENLAAPMVFANERTALFVTLGALHAAAWLLLARRQGEEPAGENA